MGSELIMPAQSEAEQHVKIRLKAGAGADSYSLCSVPC